jgi:hypothetical protein
MRGALHVDDDPTKNAPRILKYANTPDHLWEMMRKWFDAKNKSHDSAN